MIDREEFRAKREAMRKSIYASLSDEQRKAYDATADKRAAYDALPGSEKKRITEMNIFAAFAESATLLPEPNSVTNEEPRRPDIRCMIAGTPRYFELGEITDEDLATNYKRSLKTGEITGGAFSQEIPFIE